MVYRQRHPPMGAVSARVSLYPCGMTEPLLTEGDLVRGRGPDLVNQHWRCAVVDPATGAVCTLRPHDEGDEHKGLAAVQGTGRSTKVVSWTGGKERAMVLDAYRWTRLPGSNIEIRALTDRPLAMRYRHRG